MVLLWVVNNATIAPKWWGSCHLITALTLALALALAPVEAHVFTLSVLQLVISQ